MRAVVLRGGELEVVELDDPTPGPGQVLIAPHYTGICGSDLHLREVMTELAAAAPRAVPPIVPGHEFAGEVVEVGPDTDSRFRAGDLVTANPFTMGTGGPETIGLSPTRSGGLAELTVADAARTVHLPDGLDTRLGALCEPVAVAVRALHRGATAGPIVVVGAGPIGLAIVAIAAIEQRHPIVVIEPSPSRRALAERLGADAVHEPGTPIVDLLAEIGFAPSTISPLLDDDPAAVSIIECVGRPAIVGSILSEAPPHAHVVLAGACAHPVEMQPLELTTREITVDTSFAYRPTDFIAAANHLRSHTDRFAQLITSERALGETNAAFEALANEPSEIKILIKPTNRHNVGKPTRHPHR